MAVAGSRKPEAGSRKQVADVKTVAPHDRPREKLERLGVSGLGDNELLAIVLGHGDTRTSALELANAALAAVGGLDGLARATPDDLRRIAGIGVARAAQLVAAVEIGRRSLTRRREARPQILSAVDAARLLVPQFGALPVEQFGVLLLDTKHRVVRLTRLSVGTLDASIVHPREVFRAATAAAAAALVLFHNHPSGDPTPSQDDIALTRRLVRAGDLMGIAVLDHVIVAENGFASLRERGDLNG
jgi:DNA repair protein RadC